MIKSYLDGVAELLTVAALDLGVIPRFRAVPREMAHLIAVPAGDIGGILGLIALLGNMVLGAAVAASALLGVRALFCVSVVTAS